MNVSCANGTSTSYPYDNTNRLLQLANAGSTEPATYGYSYDLVGNRTSMLINGTEQHAYTYDHIYQLTDVNYPEGHFQGDTGFTYDAAGNRSAVDDPPTTYLSNSLNQYTFVGAEAFDYDDNGNLTSDGHHSYTYNAENRLVTTTVAGQSVQYTYDGAGTLLRRFIYGPGLDEPICLHTRDQVGDLTGDARVDLDDLLALAGQWLLTDADPEYAPLYDLTQDGKIDNADVDVLSAHWRELTGSGPVQVFYYHFDGLGSVVALSDAAGEVVATYAYDVYGRSQPAGTTHGNPYRFTARRWDAETGLYYYRARYYHPTIGRFLQPDPIGYADGINWYTYCGNNPIIFVDPWGLGSKLASGSWWDRSYVGRSAQQLVLGDYTEHVTLLGTGAQIGTGLLGVDLPGDIRDIGHSFTHWEWSPGHVGMTALNIASVLPVVGVLKYGDEGATLAKRGVKAVRGGENAAAATGRKVHKQLRMSRLSLRSS